MSPYGLSGLGFMFLQLIFIVLFYFCHWPSKGQMTLVLFLLGNTVMFILSFMTGVFDPRDALVSGPPWAFNLFMSVMSLIISGSFFAVMKNSTPFRKCYELIDKNYFAGYNGGLKVTNDYLTAALRSLATRAQQINLQVDDRPEAKWTKLQDFAAATSTTQGHYVKVGTDLKLCHTFLADTFLTIYKEIDKEFLERIDILAQYESAILPQFLAKPIVDAAGRALGAGSQYATSLEGFDEFYKLYSSTDLASYSKSVWTERMFVCDIDTMKTCFAQQCNDIRIGQTNHMKGLGALFSKDEFVPDLFWVLEWHYKNYWEVLFCEKGPALDFKRRMYWNSPLDFMIADMNNNQCDVVFLVQKLHNPTDFYNLGYPMCEVTTRDERDGDTLNFYSALKEAHATFFDHFPIGGFASYFASNGIGLAEIQKKFRDRTAESDGNGWTPGRRA